jgi:hypothetical protein
LGACLISSLINHVGRRGNHELTLMHTKADEVERVVPNSCRHRLEDKPIHPGHTDSYSGFVIPSPRIKGERIRIYPDSRLRGFELRHSDFPCHAVLSRRSFSADGSLERRRVIFPIRDIRAIELMGSAR